MKPNISDAELEAYMAGALGWSDCQRIETTLAASPELQSRLAELQRERETLDAVRDSFAIRLSEDEEDRIISKSLGRLGTTLGESGK